MCGICGIISFNGPEPTKTSLNTMLQFLQRRGPDFHSAWVAEGVALGHSRLSIVDLSPEGHQPMHSLSGRTVIVFNGEIYNFPGIKKELLDAGYKFRSNSDTEVLLNGYEHWGMEKLLGKIDGMFAFVLFDRFEKKAFIARDRLGKKPLYYYNDGESLLFSSDIRSIYALKKDKLSMDFESLDYYFTELSVPQPKTIWKEIQQLSPATVLSIDLLKGEQHFSEYWKLNIQKNYKISLGAAIEESTSLLNSAIEKRRISDVPIGCFLSGGIDSGLVTALLATQSSEKINTFTIGLSYEEMNEMPDARIVADRYNTNHHEIVLEADVLNTLPDLIEFCGEPFADSSLIPSHYVSKAIGSHVKVALSGDGGDELFGGYNEYGLAYRSFAFAKKYPNSHWRNIQVLIDKIAGRLRGKKENAGAYSDYLTRSGSRKLFREMGFLETSPLYNPAFKDSKSGFSSKLLQEKWDLFSDNNLPDNLMASSLQTRLLNDYLVKVDRASMYNSLEVRSPFLDTDLLEFAFSLPPEHKFHGNVNKYILKQIAKKYIDVNIEKRTKRGFGIPVHEWLRKDMKNWAQNIIFDGLLKRNEWFDTGFVEKIWKSHQEGTSNHVHQLWSLICFELWMQKFN